MPRNLTAQERINQIGPISENTIKARIGEWVRNVIGNEYTIRTHKGANWLFDKLSGIPTILVGAGPSLDKNLDLLKECYYKACIITCSSALKALLSKNILPHIVFVTDSKKELREIIEESGAYEKSEKMILICDTFVHPSVHEEWQGPLFFYNIFSIESCPFTGSLPTFTGQIGTLGSGGSVTTVMLCFAYAGLKCEPIIFVGQDCAYYEPTKHHVTEVSKSVSNPAIAYQPIEMEDFIGQKCFTNKGFLSFCYWFEDFFLHHEGTFINATEGGILTSGVSFQPLAHVIKTVLFKDYDIMALLLDETTVRPNAQEANRWSAQLTETERVPITMGETYLPADYLGHIIRNCPEELLFENLSSNQALLTKFYDAQEYTAQLRLFLENTINELSKINLFVRPDKNFRNGCLDGQDNQQSSSNFLDHKSICGDDVDLETIASNHLDFLYFTDVKNKNELFKIIAQTKRILKKTGTLLLLLNNKTFIELVAPFFTRISVLQLKAEPQLEIQFKDCQLSISKSKFGISITNQETGLFLVTLSEN